MKKPHLTMLLIVVIICGLAFFNCLHFIVAQTGTQVSGIINQDTTWTKANSPYNLTGLVSVNIGVTLTVEAGVTVNLNVNYIQVNGTLCAKGTGAEPIYFNGGGGITFTSVSDSWNEQSGTGCLLENAIVVNATISVYGSPKIDNSIISSPIYVYGGSPLITNNTIVNFGISILSGLNVTVSSNVISNGRRNGIYLEGNFGGKLTIENNLIVGNHIGIQVFSTATIRNNTIANNSEGIELNFDAPLHSEISYNNILNNTVNIDVLASHFNVNAAYNWWGTTDTQAVNQTMYDKKNYYVLGAVNFVPFLSAPNPEAPAIPTSTPSPTANQSPTPSQTPSPSIPEFPLWIILPALLVVSALMAAAIKRKTHWKRSRQSSLFFFD